MSEQYRYVVQMEIKTTFPVSLETLEELGREIVEATDAFMHSKRCNGRVEGVVDIYEGS